jgi:hypothetical protein
MGYAEAKAVLGEISLEIPDETIAFKDALARRVAERLMLLSARFFNKLPSRDKSILHERADEFLTLTADDSVIAQSANAFRTAAVVELKGKIPEVFNSELPPSRECFFQSLSRLSGPNRVLFRMALLLQTPVADHEYQIASRLWIIYLLGEKADLEQWINAVSTDIPAASLLDQLAKLETIARVPLAPAQSATG